MDKYDKEAAVGESNSATQNRVPSTHGTHPSYTHSDSSFALNLYCYICI